MRKNHIFLSGGKQYAREPQADYVCCVVRPPRRRLAPALRQRVRGTGSRQPGRGGVLFGSAHRHGPAGRAHGDRLRERERDLQLPDGHELPGARWRAHVHADRDGRLGQQLQSDVRGLHPHGVQPAGKRAAQPQPGEDHGRREAVPVRQCR